MKDYTNKLVYVAGPYSSDTDEGREKNVAMAASVGAEVMSGGGYAIIPHTMWNPFYDLYDESIFVRGGIELLLHCNMILVFGDWEDSRGTTEEIYHALDNGIDVVFHESAQMTEEALYR